MNAHSYTVLLAVFVSLALTGILWWFRGVMCKSPAEWWRRRKAQLDKESYLKRVTEENNKRQKEAGSNGEVMVGNVYSVDAGKNIDEESATDEEDEADEAELCLDVLPDCNTNSDRIIQALEESSDVEEDIYGVSRQL